MVFLEGMAPSLLLVLELTLLQANNSLDLSLANLYTATVHNSENPR